MKKLLAAVLSLAMTLSLVSPALAAQAPVSPAPVPPALEVTELQTIVDAGGTKAVDPARKAWQDAYLAAHAAEIAAFDPDAYLKEIWDTSSKEEYMELLGLTTDEAYRESLLEEYLEMFYQRDTHLATARAYEKSNPVEAKAFDVEAFYKEHLDGNTKAEIMQMLHITDEAELRLVALGSVLEGAAAQAAALAEGEAKWAKIQKDEPQRAAQFLQEFAGFFAREYGYYENLEAYQEDQGFVGSGEAYSALYDEWKTQLEHEEAAQKVRDEFITAHGGVPGTLNVMVNGTFLTFQKDALPRAVDGVTSVPAAALPQDLKAAAADANGYVPLRQTAEKAGYQVSWDDQYNAVVLVSSAALAAKLDEKFTVMNTVLAKNNDGKTHENDGTFKVDVTLLDSLDGDKTYSVTGTAKSSIRDGATNTTLTVDLTQLLKIPGLTQLVGQMGKELSLAEGVNLLTQMSHVKLEMMSDAKTGVTYLRSSLLSMVLTDVPENGWLAVTGVPTPGAATLGSVLAPLALLLGDMMDYSAVPVRQWDSAAKLGDACTALMGDARFTKAGGGWDYKLTKEDMTKILTDLMGQMDDDKEISGALTNLFRECSITIHLDQNYNAQVSATVRPDLGGVMDGLLPGASILTTLLPWTDFRMTAKSTSTATRDTTEMELHFKNTLKCALTAQSTLRTTDTAVQTAPTAGETIVKAEDL